MNRVLTVLLTLALGVHATAGCCMHHQHNCEAGCCETPAPTANACTCGHHHGAGELADVDSRDSSNDHSQQPSHDRHQCEGDKCTFALTKPPVAPILVATAMMPVPSAELRPRIETAADVGPPKAPAGPPGMKLHLVLAILVI